MALKLSLANRDDSGIAHLANEGEIIAADFTAHGPNPFEKALGPEWASMKIVLDLDRTPYIDSSGIGWLIQSQKEAKTRGGKIVLAGVSPQVRQVLDMLKIHRIVPIAPTRAEATQLFNS